MTKPDPTINIQIEEMRARLTENAQHEQALLRALADALGQVDQQLLSEVRQVTAEHEARRSDILSELHVLASRLCVFPKPLGTERLKTQEHAGTLSGVVHHEVATTQPRNGKARHAPGDWRQAASNIDDELDFYLDARTQTN